VARALNARATPDRSTIGIWIALLGLYLVVRAQLLAVPLERDEGLYGVIGQAILRGEVPYRDVFEHKPPGLFYLYALAVLLVPPTATGLHTFLLVWNLGTALCASSIAAALATPVAARWTMLLFTIASASAAVEGFALTSEMLILLPLTLSLRLALAAVQGERTRVLLLVASGALGALAFWVKQPAAVAGAIAPLVILAARRGAPRRARTELGLWSAGAVAVSLAATVPFAALGVWDEFWYWAFTHSLLYGQIGATHWGQRVLGSLANLGRDLGWALAAGVGGSLFALWMRRPGAWVGLAFLALSVVSAFHSQFLYLHYFALLTPAAAIAGGLGLAWLQEACERRFGAAGARLFVFASVLLAVGTPVLARPWYWLRPDPVAVSNRTLGLQGFDAAPLLAAYLRERVRPDERFFVYGSEPEIAFVAERRDLNPFVVVYPLTWDWPRHREFQERLWAEIERWRPPYILVPQTPYTLVRSPRMDPFLEEKLLALGRAEYRVEARLVVDAARRFELVEASAARPLQPGASILYEIWRRRS
jgi:hypothetical protein